MKHKNLVKQANKLAEVKLVEECRYSNHYICETKYVTMKWDTYISKDGAEEVGQIYVRRLHLKDCALSDYWGGYFPKTIKEAIAELSWVKS